MLKSTLASLAVITGAAIFHPVVAGAASRGPARLQLKGPTHQRAIVERTLAARDTKISQRGSRVGRADIHLIRQMAKPAPDVAYMAARTLLQSRYQRSDGVTRELASLARSSYNRALRGFISRGKAYLADSANSMASAADLTAVEELIGPREARFARGKLPAKLRREAHKIALQLLATE